MAINREEICSEIMREKPEKKDQEILPRPQLTVPVPSSSSNLCRNSPPLQSLPSSSILCRSSPPLQSIPFSTYHLIIHPISVQEHNKPSSAKAFHHHSVLDSIFHTPARSTTKPPSDHLLGISLLCTRAQQHQLHQRSPLASLEEVPTKHINHSLL